MDGQHTRKNATDHSLKRNFHKQAFYTFYDSYKVLILGLFGAFFMVAGSSVVKSLTDVNLETILTTRYIGLFIFNLPILVRSQNVVFKSDSAPTLLIRSISFLCGTCLFVLAITLMPIGDAFVITCSTPAFACILSKIILKENFDLFNSLSVASTLLSLIFMSRVFSLVSDSPSNKYSDLYYWLGCVSELGSSLLAAFSMTCVRKLRNVADCVILGHQSATGLIALVSFCLVRWKFDLPKCGWDAAMLVLIGLVSLQAQMLLTMSVKCDKAGAASSLQTAAQVAWSFLVQMIIFGEVPDVHTALAAVCVFVSLWLSALRKRRQVKRRKANANKELKETRV